ncbi:nucleotidyltransferase substrate binding protein [bacterium]|nr:nucleotidyltransferase substrate binding protein [bacterium]
MKKSELDLTLLKNSLATLKECWTDLNIQQDEKIKIYIKDSCIQRFEYTYESAKKIMNKFLKKEYDKTEKDLSINNIFREMYSLGLIENFENWVEYREKRNITSHEYNLKLTYTILDCVQNFINDVEFLVDNLEKVLTDD